MAIAEAPGTDRGLERPSPAIDMDAWRMKRAADQLARLAQAPTAVLPEVVLFHAHRGGQAPVERVEACVCGGLIAAIDGDDQSIQAAIERHNESIAHRAWRFR